MAEYTPGPWTLHNVYGGPSQRLISAAPEMLEVLEMVQADNIATQQGGWCYLDVTTIEALTAIIAKAKGEAHAS